MRPRGSSVSSRLLAPDSPDPASPGPTRLSYSGLQQSTLQPTLASLYSTSPLDLDNERLDRYSVPPPPPGRNSVTSLASSPSLTGSDHRASVRATSAVPFFAPVYSIGKDKWEPEEDDFLHEYEGKNPRVGPAFLIEETTAFRGGSHWGLRGVANTLAMLLLVLAIVGVFLGYPVAEHFVSRAYVNTTSYIDGGNTTTTSTTTSSTPTVTGTDGLINSNAPNISNRALIDPDTPTSAYTKTGIDDEDLILVFSDEFNIDGRTFYMGEDPFWEMVDLHYWQTDDLEWYDPGQAITENGSLAITLEKTTDANSHGLGYLGGMIQSWNKFCFTGGRIEAAVSLPGSATVSGLWPSVWLLGNLGRAGYGASLDGAMTLATSWAPMNPNYYIVNSSTSNVDYYTTDWDTTVNSYLGGAYQQSTSALSSTNSTAYNSTTAFSVYGVDYTPTYLGGAGTGEINWINQGEVMWFLSDTAMVANTEAEVSQRPVSGEPMSVIANLGLSTSFTTISTSLVYPATMRIDYIRIGSINIGCSPPLYPTADYIADNLAAYSNPNLTTYAQYLESVNSSTTTFPKNRLIDTC